MSDNNDAILDEELIAGELRKILEQELPPSKSREQKELYHEIERRIAIDNEKLFAEKIASKKKANIGLPVKAKLLAASSLAKSRAELKSKKQEAMAKASMEGAKGEEGLKISDLGESLTKKYRTSQDSIRKQLEEEGIFRKFQDSDSDNSDLEDPGDVDYSPLNKLKRSIRKARALSRFEKAGAGDKKSEEEDSDEDMRAVRQESESWLKKQKDLEKQLMAKASKGALKQRYMTKGSEAHEDVPATDKRIDELLDRVIKDSNMKLKGKSGSNKSQDRRTEGGPNKARTDMADIVKRALALRQEAEAAGSREKSKCASRKTAKKPFPVKLESSSSESHYSESGSSSDNDEASDTSIKRFDIPDLDSITDSSEDDNEKLEKFKKRSKPKFSFSKPSSFDMTEVDDVMAIEDAKRKLGKKPDQWSSKLPSYKKFEPKPVETKSSETNSKTKSRLISNFPPEVEALRSKMAQGGFGLGNDFLNSDKLLNNNKKEIPTKLQSSTNHLAKDGKKEPETNRMPNIAKKTPTKPPISKRDLPEMDSVKKMLDRNKPGLERTKQADLKTRRPSLGSGRSATKFI